MLESGTYKNNLNKDLSYQSFRPTSLFDISKQLVINNNISKLLGEASNQIGRLDGISANIKNIDLFIGSYVRKEALYSSQIEGTQATLEDVFNPKIFSLLDSDITDVVNYVNAMNYAIQLKDTLPLCNRFLRKVHVKLLNGVRGQNKCPGEFRKTQNWIGAAGSTLYNARYIPPCVTDMNECLSDLEKYMNDDTVDINDLIKIALIHYQFETIHPFLDGNGRIGRMLIVFYLLNKKIIHYPSFYLSYYFKKNQFEYYTRLEEVRKRINLVNGFSSF
ncbi:MAG: Fic/DOC family N-terminal domain-containing protein [Bacilli bacterium]